MSSIPSAKMKHAHAHEGDHPEGAEHHTHQAEAQGGQPASASGEQSSERQSGGQPAVNGATPGAPKGQSSSAPAGQSAERSPPADAGYAEPQPGAGAKLAQRAKDLGGQAQHLAGEAVDAVKARPKTAAAIGAAIVAGAAAIVAGPALAERLRGEDDEPAPKRKSPVKKGATKRAANKD